MQDINLSQPSEKCLAAGEEQSVKKLLVPQLSVSSQASGVHPSQHGSLFPRYPSQQSTHRVDMDSMCLALPEAGGPALFHSNGVAAQYADMSFRPQIPTYSGQAYSSKIATYPSMTHSHTHPSTTFPGQYYNPLGAWTPQTCV